MYIFIYSLLVRRAELIFKIRGYCYQPSPPLQPHNVPIFISISPTSGQKRKHNKYPLLYLSFSLSPTPAPITPSLSHLLFSTSCCYTTRSILPLSLSTPTFNFPSYHLASSRLSTLGKLPPPLPVPAMSTPYNNRI